MRAILPTLLVALVVSGCQRRAHSPLVVEDKTPIVKSGRTTESLGIQTLGGVFTLLINSGTVVPCSHFEKFSTASDGQKQITIMPFRGTNRLVANNVALGRFQIVGIPKGPRGTPKIEVTFSITQEQILMSAKDWTHQTILEIQKINEDHPETNGE